MFLGGSKGKLGRKGLNATVILILGQFHQLSVIQIVLCKRSAWATSASLFIQGLLHKDQRIKALKLCACARKHLD